MEKLELLLAAALNTEGLVESDWYQKTIRDALSLRPHIPIGSDGQPKLVGRAQSTAQLLPPAIYLRIFSFLLSRRYIQQFKRDPWLSLITWADGYSKFDPETSGIANLVSLTLVCHSWHEPARETMYRYVSLASPRHMHSFVESIHRDPSLALLVKSTWLIIPEPEMQVSRLRWTMKKTPAKPSPDLQLNRALWQCFNQDTVIIDLSSPVYRKVFNPFDPSFTPVSSRLLNLVVTGNGSIKIPPLISICIFSLETLTITDVVVGPDEFFPFLPRLSTLNIIRCKWKLDEAAESPTIIFRGELFPTLRNLHFWETDVSSNSIESSLISHLGKIRYLFSGMTELPPWLTLARNLQRLTLGVPFNMERDFLHVQSLPHLKKLTVVVIFSGLTDLQMYPQNILVRLCDDLGRDTSFSCLSRLDIHLIAKSNAILAPINCVISVIKDICMLRDIEFRLKGNYAHFGLTKFVSNSGYKLVGQQTVFSNYYNDRSAPFGYR